MAKVFISYRREDSAYAVHAIYDRLAAQFGSDSIVFDVDTIPLGVDFVEYLNDQVSGCDVLLAVIGDSWLDCTNEKGKRRLDNSEDFVRIEIAAALRRKIPIVPVLVGRVSMPKREDLPRGLKTLPRWNAAEVRSGRDFQSHLDRLVRGLSRVLEESTSKGYVPEEPPRPPVQHKPAPTTPEPVEKSPEPPKRPVPADTSPTRPAHKPASGETFTNSLDAQLALIPTGEFTMGASESDDEARDDERPQHRVGTTKPFYLGIYPVTQREFQTVIGENPSVFSRNGDCPVENVTWFTGIEFCNRLSETENLEPYYATEGENVTIRGGTGYRLPTEAEWEYACRAGSETKWWFGDDPSRLDEFAWTFGNSQHPPKAGFWWYGTLREARKSGSSVPEESGKREREKCSLA